MRQRAMMFMYNNRPSPEQFRGDGERLIADVNGQEYVIEGNRLVLWYNEPGTDKFVELHIKQPWVEELILRMTV